MSDSVIPTRGQAGQIRESPLIAEVTPTEAIPTLGNAPKRKIVPEARKNRMAIRTLKELQLRHWKSRTKRRKLADEDDLAEPWTCEDVDPFTPRIRNFKSSRKTRMPNNGKTYDGTGDPEDHLKIFLAAAQVECWAMPTWCHMFNSTLIGAARVWFDELHPESIDGYKGLKAAFLAYFMQQKKYVKDPVEIHNIKQRDRRPLRIS
ncbi:reverse transcriptase domain-containing protein [Tanacetum coccineum]